jgi:hypothetical protein
MIILGKGYKDNKILVIVSIIVMFIACVVLAILSIILSGGDRIPAIVLFCICFVSFLLLSYIGITQHLTKDNVICYNNEKDEFIISLFRKQLSIKVDDIREVKCKNKRLASLTVFLWVQEYVDCHLVFYLKNSTKIRTPMIKSVKDVQYEISEIVKRQ